MRIDPVKTSRQFLSGQTVAQHNTLRVSTVNPHQEETGTVDGAFQLQITGDRVKVAVPVLGFDGVLNDVTPAHLKGGDERILQGMGKHPNGELSSMVVLRFVPKTGVFRVEGYRVDENGQYTHRLETHGGRVGAGGKTLSYLPNE